MMALPPNRMQVKQEPVKQEPAPHGQVIVTKESNLDDLFSVLKPNKDPNMNSQIQSGSSLRNRNLPQSFFTPPEPRSPSHSHSNSIDGSNGLQQVQVPGLPIHHARAFSSPLPHNRPATYSLPAAQHGRQGSMDGILETANQTSQPLSLSNQFLYSAGAAGNKPMAVVGPKAAVSGEWAQQQQQQQEPTAIVVDMTTLVKHSHPALNPNGIPQQFGVILQLLGQLPANWVPAVTPDYEIYFINHNDKNTHWFPPQTPVHVSKCGPMKIFRPQILSPRSSHPQLASQQQQMSPASSQVSLAAAQPSPAQGVILAPQQQSPPHAAVQAAAAAAAMGGGQSPHGDPQHIMLELQRLHQEREKLRYQQEMIQRKEAELKMMVMGHQQGTPTMVGVAAPLHGGGGVMMGHAHKSPAAMVSAASVGVSANSMDPFLGRTALVQESHARQNSADSGLGGMGTGGYSSLPRTPDDFLAHVDEMDTADAVMRRQQQQQQQQRQQQQQQQHQQMLGSAAVDFGEMTSMDIVDFAPVDGDELVPSLQDVPELTDISMDGFNQWL